jgi:cyclophilin family peptidyl-prolyl cis-trans isomerase
VFGTLSSGADVVKKIETTPTDQRDNPTTPVRVNKITVAGY